MSMTSRSRTRQDLAMTDRSLSRTLAAIVGVVFLLVGVAGFVPGITTDTDAMEFSGPESGAMLLDTFQVSVLHNIVHIAFGLVGLLAAYYGARSARTFLLAGGAAYLLLFVYGIIVDKADDANFLPMNRADDWLHLGLGLGMLALGLIAVAAEDRSRTGRVDPMTGERHMGDRYSNDLT
jgi:hypothetical protein